MTLTCNLQTSKSIGVSYYQLGLFLASPRVWYSDPSQLKTSMFFPNLNIQIPNQICPCHAEKILIKIGQEIAEISMVLCGHLTQQCCRMLQYIFWHFCKPFTYIQIQQRHLYNKKISITCFPNLQILREKFPNFTQGLFPKKARKRPVYGGQLPIQCSWVSNQYKPCSSQVTDNFSTWHVSQWWRTKWL